MVGVENCMICLFGSVHMCLCLCSSFRGYHDKCLFSQTMKERNEIEGIVIAGWLFCKSILIRVTYNLMQQ